MPITADTKIPKNNPNIKLQNYRHIATHGAFWNIGMAGANKVVTLVGQVALAWILTPKDMGLAGMAIAMAGFAHFMGAGSIGDVLVQRNNYKKEAGQGFWLSITLSFITSCFVALLAPIAIWMGRRDLSKMLLILALFPLADLPTPIFLAFLKSNLDFKNIALSSFASGLTYTFCALVLALLGLGPYSLIIPVIPRSIASWGFMALSAKWPVIRKPQLKIINSLIRPSLAMSVIGFLNGLQTQAPIFFVGLILDPQSVGYFTWGWMVASQAVFLLSINLRQILMPVFVKLGMDPNRQAVATLKAAKAITLVLIFACGLQALIAEPLLHRFFPTKWHASGSVITWISLGLAFQGIYTCVVSWLNAIGSYRMLLFLTILQVTLGTGMAYLGATITSVQGASQGCAVGLALVSFFSLACMPWDKIKMEINFFSLVILICGISWYALHSFSENSSSLIILFICIFIFSTVNILVWFSFGDEQFKNILRNAASKVLNRLNLVNKYGL